MTSDKKYVALVTGATGGLGTHMCQNLHNDGYIVCANYRTRTTAEKWNDEMKEQGYDFKLYEGDVSDPNEVKGMIERIESDYGNVDILVNNAGITRDGSFKKMSYENWDIVLKTNLYSVFNCTRAVINQMLAQNYGRIINISSVNAQRGQFGQANYSAAKARNGITVNTISPGYIATDMVMAVPEEIREKIVKGIPVGRLGGTHEIAHLVSFLASEKAAFITGANYAINGGQHVY